MLSVLFGVLGATTYGAADFFGGLAARLVGSLRTVWMNSIVGLILLSAMFFIFGGVVSNEAWFWGGLSGLVGIFAMMLLYASLAIGPMSVVSPIGALVSAVVPVIWDIASGTELAPLSYVAIVVALVAVWLVGFVAEPGGTRPNAKGLILAVAAGTLIGTFYILLELAPDDAGLLPMVSNRAVQVVFTTVMVVVLTVMHRSRSRQAQRSVVGGASAESISDESVDIAAGEHGQLQWRRAIPFAVLAGVFDSLANVFVLFGFVVGKLSIVSVLVALYPATTILLAAVILRERIHKWQYLGFALAILAAIGLALD